MDEDTEQFDQVPERPDRGQGPWVPPIPAPPAAPPPRRRRAVAAIVAALVLAASGAAIGIDLTRANRSPTNTVQAPVAPANPGSGQGGAFNAQQVAAGALPAVVDINTLIGAFAGGKPGSGQPRAAAAGTGMVLTSSGEVLTNNHVIAGATTIKVEFPNRGSTYTATVIGADPSADVALLQIQGVSNLPTVTLGDSSSVKVGQRVVAVGNALGAGGAPSVTSGFVTAIGRSVSVGGNGSTIEHLTNVIQADAEISPGDSGGPLLNEAGQVIGIITAGQDIGPTHRVSKVDFAITSNVASGIATEMRAGHGSSTILLGQRGFLGVQVQDLDAASAAQLGLSGSAGALVVGVVPNTPAAQAGIVQPAVITEVDGQRIASPDQLGPIIFRHVPGESIRVTWVDRSGTHSAAVTLVAGPAV